MTRYRLYRIEPCNEGRDNCPCWGGEHEIRTDVVVEPDDASCGDDTITVYLEVTP